MTDRNGLATLEPKLSKMLESLKKTRGQKYSVDFSELQKIKELGLETLAEKKEKYHEWWDGLRG